MPKYNFILVLSDKLFDSEFISWLFYNDMINDFCKRFICILTYTDFKIHCFPRFAADDSVQLQLSVHTCSNDGVGSKVELTLLYDHSVIKWARD